VLKGLANFGSIIKQAQQMGERMQEMNEQLKSVRATGSAGGGLVEVEVNGLGEMLQITIDPTLIEKKDRELIEDLVPAAANQANAKAKEHHAEAMKDLTGGINLPGLHEAMDSISGGSPPDAPQP
jgi:hypothetical protein